MQKINETHTIDSLREFFKQWPQFYFFIVYFFGPVYLGYMSPRQFLDKFFPQKDRGCTLLNLGSGPRTVRKDVVNVDIHPYESVSIIASLTNLPFKDGDVDGFVCDNVLEHVENPERAVSEMKRIMKVGAVGYISTPFQYPFHSSPSDYTRWTEQGLRLLFKEFEIVEIGARAGYFSTLTVVLCYGLSALFSFGSERLYWILLNLSLLLFFPLKFLDVIGNRLPLAAHTASVFYCVIRKHP
jgi:SAM-dependent methyltransferase